MRPSPAGARGQEARPAGRAPRAAGGSLKAPIHGLGRPRGPLVAPAAPEVFARCQKKRRTQVAAIKRPFYGRGLCDSVTRQTPTVAGPRRQRPLSSGPRPCLAVPRRPPSHAPSEEGAAIASPQQTPIWSPAWPGGAGRIGGCSYPSEVVGSTQGAPRPSAAMNKRPSSKRRCSWVLSGPAGQRLCGAELPVGAAGPGPLGSDACVRERRRPSRTGGAVGSWLRTNRMACRLPRSPAGSGPGRPWRSIALTWKVRPTPKEEQGAVGRAHSSRLPGSSPGPARTMRLPQAPRLRSRRKDYPATWVLALGEPRLGADRRGC